jgi:hypothetical protein
VWASFLTAGGQENFFDQTLYKSIQYRYVRTFAISENFGVKILVFYLLPYAQLVYVGTF